MAPKDSTSKRAVSPPTDFEHHHKDLDWTIHEAMEEYEEYERNEDAENGAEMIRDHVKKIVKEVVEKCGKSSRPELRVAAMEFFVHLGEGDLSHLIFGSWLADNGATEALKEGVGKVIEMVEERKEDLGAVKGNIEELHRHFKQETDSDIFRDLAIRVGMDVSILDNDSEQV